MIEQISVQIIKALSKQDLYAGMVPTRIPNPIVTTKFKALDLNDKYIIWHCEQLGILKRIINRCFYFGSKTVN